MRIMHCNLTSISSRSVRQYITLRTFLQDSSCRTGNFWSLTWCSCSSFISIDCLIRQNPMRAMTAIWFTTHIKGKNGDTFHYVHKLKVAPPLLPLACKTSHIAWKKWHVSFLVDTSNDVIASEYTWIEMHAYHKTRHRRAIDSYRFNDSEWIKGLCIPHPVRYGTLLFLPFSDSLFIVCWLSGGRKRGRRQIIQTKPAWAELI